MLEHAENGDVMAAKEEQNIEQLLMEIQGQNQQLQTVLLQKQTLTLQVAEVERAVAELEKASDEVYKSVGPILVKTSKETMKNELTDLKEEIELKITSMGKQEKRIKERLKESQETFQGLATKLGGGKPPVYGG